MTTTTNNQELVKIRLPKNKELQDDVFVSVNHRTWLIQRGVTVEVPACVAEVLQHSEEMADVALRYETQMSSGD